MSTKAYTGARLVSAIVRADATTPCCTCSPPREQVGTGEDPNMLSYAASTKHLHLPLRVQDQLPSRSRVGRIQINSSSSPFSSPPLARRSPLLEDRLQCN